MKKIIKSGFALMVLAIIFTRCAASNVIVENPNSPNVTYQTFYDNLSPYGSWIDYPGYGHVWHPMINGEFRPYLTNGYWNYSNEGWFWMSNYTWGWAPFHYGQWIYDDAYGWLWIPGYDWSPAWVTWGFVDNYYCWAPLMPGVNLSLQFGSWRPHSFYWNIVSRDHIYGRNLSAFIEKPGHIANFAGRISIINNFNTTKSHNLYYSKGPDVNEVQKFVSQRIGQTSIKDVNRIREVKHSGNVMNVYRPPVQDPKVTARENPQQVIEPREFRKADGAQSKLITKEEQWPAMQRSEQKTNIERLPLRRSAGGGGNSRRR